MSVHPTATNNQQVSFEKESLVIDNRSTSLFKDINNRIRTQRFRIEDTEHYKEMVR